MERCAYAKIGKRRVRIFARLLSRFDESFMFGHATPSSEETKRDFSLGSK
jgi:hypothetical protein